MLGTSCPYRSDQHRIIHPELERWVKRQVSDPKLRDSLFVYHHLQVGTFVIAQWTVPDRWFVDVLNLGSSLANFDRGRAEMFKITFLQPVGKRQLGRALGQGYMGHLRGLQQQNDEEKEYRQWRSDRRTCRKVMSGATGK
jgi:hypothetical protein